MVKAGGLIRMVDRCIAPRLLAADAEPSRLYRARIAVGLAFAFILLSLVRSLLFNFATLPTLLCLGMVFLCLAGIAAIRYSQAFERTAFFLLVTLLSLEAGLAIASQSIFSTFYSWLPLGIAFSCFFSGLKWGGLFALVGVAEALLMIHFTRYYGPQISIYAPAGGMLLGWQIHFLTIELISAVTLLAFSKIRQKAEDELQSRQLLRVKTTRKAALADVVGSLAHELNNPLAIIHGSLLRYQHELSKGEVEPNLRQYIFECMDDALVRIEGVATGLRTFASGDANEPMRPIALHRLIQLAERQAKDRIRASGAVLTLSLPQAEINLVCRPQQIILVLKSLLENAAESLKEDTRQPQIKILCVATRSRLRIEVVDNGRGIEPDIAERLFQPYVTRSSGESLGMALSICRGIIEEHGGRIGFALASESSDTYFWFELPLDSGGDA